MSQGLRRSGTTILFDILSEDSRFCSFYEPLCRGGTSVGGGSGAKSKDVMRSLRAARDEYSLFNNIDQSLGPFNFGAPKDYNLEVFRGKCTREIELYLDFLLGYGENCLLKFTRATFMIRNLYRLDRNAVFIHIEKNPARWVMSHIFKRNYNAPAARDSDMFFKINTGYNMWSQGSISDAFLKRKNRKLLSRPGYFKLLYIWHAFNRIIESDGRKFYGDKYLKVSNERLCENPRDIIMSIYNLADMEHDESVISWAEENLRPPREILFADDERWHEAFDEIGIDKKYLV
jgi:hypothetical protein